MENQRVYLAALLYSAIIGLSFMFTKIALRSSNPIDILAFRFMAAFLAVMIAVNLRGICLNYSWAKIKRILPLAILYPLMFFSFQTFGLQYATSSEAGIIQAISPILTLIFATYFLKEKINKYQRISILLSVTGVLYIMIMKGSTLNMENLKGILLLSLAPLSIAGYNVLARILTREFSSIELSVMMISISFLCFNVLSIIRHLFQGTLSSFFAPITKIDFVLAIFYLGVLATLTTSLLTNYILSKLEASKMSVFANLGTVITIVAGVVILKEEVFYYHLLGSLFIVGGVLGTNFLDDRKVKKRPKADENSEIEKADKG